MMGRPIVPTIPYMPMTLLTEYVRRSLRMEPQAVMKCLDHEIC